MIGDTPRDIACARADGVLCIAVATGPYPAAELSEAEEVVASAAKLRPALERAMGWAGKGGGRAAG